MREIQLHQELRRNQLRDKHGPIFEEFDSVHRDLEALAHEFRLLTDQSVALDANFSKFGYSAHLRTTDPTDSSASSISDGASRHGSRDWDAERQALEPFKFWRRPVVRQYFHKGLLWRSSRSGEVASFELFIDLVYVGVIDHVGEKAVLLTTGKSLVEYLIQFSIGWKIWSDLTMVINWFEVNDVLQRIGVLFILVCLVGFTTNLEYGFETTYTSMIAFFLAQRLFLAVYCLWVAYLVPTVSGTMVYNALVAVIASAFWIGSIHVEYPNQLALVFIAIVIDLFGSVLVIYFVELMRKSKNRAMVWTTKHFDFLPAINIEHRVERTNAFVALVFGYSVLTLFFQSHAEMGINAYFGKAILALIQAFAFNWIYFEIDQFNVHVHAIRRSRISATIWISAHLPFIMGYVLAAASLTRLVLAHDFAHADPEHDLGHAYAEESEAELSDGMRWYYCGGLGVALIGMAVISLCHVHKKLATRQLRKRTRLAFRVCIAIVIICLPLAHSLTSLHLISITTCLTILVLGTDIYGNMCRHERFFRGGFCEASKKASKYSADIKIHREKRKELDAAMKKGEKVGLEHVVTEGGHEKEPATKEWTGGHY